MLRNIAIATTALALMAAPALAGSHGGGKKMMKKMDCAAKLQKMEKMGMKGEKYAMMRKKAMKKLKAGDEKGCMAAVREMKKMKGGMGKSY